MSMSEIIIYRQLPIINNRVTNRYNSHEHLNAVTAEIAMSGSMISNMSTGSGRPRGWKTGAQEWLELPGVAADAWYATDPQDNLSY